MDQTSAVLWLLVIVAVFLMCREVVCWYWKVNEVVAILRDIRKALGADPAEIAHEKWKASQAATRPPPAPAAAEL